MFEHLKVCIYVTLGSSREDVSKILSSEKHVSYNETAEQSSQQSSEQKVDGKIYLMSQSSEQGKFFFFHIAYTKKQLKCLFDINV